jgi:hypothetical protein
VSNSSCCAFGPITFYLDFLDSSCPSTLFIIGEFFAVTSVYFFKKYDKCNSFLSGGEIKKNPITL